MLDEVPTRTREIIGGEELAVRRAGTIDRIDERALMHYGVANELGESPAVREDAANLEQLPKAAGLESVR